MLKPARYRSIMDALQPTGSCSVGDLVRQLSVSDETVRRDIKVLARQGLVERVHGGVVLPTRNVEADFRQRMAQQSAEKQAIADIAAAEIVNGDTVMIDSGSTTAYVARALLDRRDLFVVTNGTEIARTLVGGRGNRVHMAGGEVRVDDYAVFGETTIGFLRNFRARIAILSIGAIHAEGGFMDYHLQEAEVARCMMDQSSLTLVVADHSKFRNLAPVNVCGFDRVDTLVCDQPPPQTIAPLLSHHETRVLGPDGAASGG